MNMKAAYKATSFMFLPTLAFLCIVFCWFFNWTDFVAFVTEKSGWAGFFRIVVMGVEVSVWVFFYLEYSKEFNNQSTAKDVIDIIKKELEPKSLVAARNLDSYDTKRIIPFLGDTQTGSTIYKTSSSDIFIIDVKLSK